MTRMTTLSGNLTTLNSFSLGKCLLSSNGIKIFRRLSKEIFPLVSLMVCLKEQQKKNIHPIWCNKEEYLSATGVHNERAMQFNHPRILGLVASGKQLHSYSGNTLSPLNDYWPIKKGLLVCRKLYLHDKQTLINLIYSSLISSYYVAIENFVLTLLRVSFSGQNFISSRLTIKRVTILN